MVDTLSKVHMVLELVDGGELFDRIITLKKLDEQTSKFIFYQIVEAVKYLHDNNITHRDLKVSFYFIF